MWLKLAQLGDLPADVTPHVLRHSFATLAADIGHNEPTIAALLGHKIHSITSRYVHSADAVLLAAADAVANATMKLMAPDQAQPQLRHAEPGAEFVGAGERRIGWHVIAACGGVAGGDHAWLGRGAAGQARCDTHLHGLREISIH
jgi:hypothetical protein